MSEWIAVGALAVVALGIPLGMMAVSWILRPSVPEGGKRATYVSGEVPTGRARVQFNIQYYMVALLFVVFDVETVLILPWTLVFRDALAQGVSLTAVFAPMLVFIGILVIGLVWAWRNGAVQWIASPQTSARKTERST